MNQTQPDKIAKAHVPWVLDAQAEGISGTLIWKRTQVFMTQKRLN